MRPTKSHSTRLLRSQTRNKEEPALESENPKEGPSPESVPVEQQNSSPTQQAHQKSEGLTCPSKKCGKVVTEPLKMVDLSKGLENSAFYVCPYCMSRLSTTTEQESTPKSSPEKTVKSTETSKTGPQSCPHYLGYLQERKKNTQIPDECLTCPETIKCMLG